MGNGELAGDSKGFSSNEARLRGRRAAETRGEAFHQVQAVMWVGRRFSVFETAKAELKQGGGWLSACLKA